MKLKIILSMITIFSVVFIDARQRGATATPTSSTVVPSSARSYMSLLAEIRKMSASFVININNPLTPLKKEFIDFVMNAGRANELAPDFIQALLEAGATLHAPLSGNREADENLIKRIFAQIETLMKTDSAIIPPAQLEFYDKETNLLNQDYLEIRVNALLDTNSLDETIKTLQEEFGPIMRREWADRKLGEIASKTKRLNDNIYAIATKINTDRALKYLEKQKDEQEKKRREREAQMQIVPYRG